MTGPQRTSSAASASRTEESLAHAQTKLALIREDVGAGFWSYDRYTGEVKADPQLLALYGYPPDGRSARDLTSDVAVWREHVHPEDLPRVEACFSEVLERVVPWELTYRIQRADGEIRHLHSLGQPKRDEDGQPRYVVGVERDVTEDVARKQALEAANERLSNAERIARLGHWVSYPDSGVLVWSRMTYELCGFDPEDPPPDIATFLERIPLENRHQVAESQFQAQPEGSVSIGIYRIQHPNGRTLWVREVAEQWRDEQGRWVVQGTVQDVTAYQEALRTAREQEQQLEAIFRNSTSVSIFQVDLNGIIQDASRSGGALFGYAREEVIGKSVRMLHTQADQDVPPRLLGRMARGRQEITEEVRPLHRSGRTFPALLNLIPMLDPSGAEVTGVISVCIDLSEQAAERERYRLAQEAARFGVWEWHLDSDSVYWDDACWRMLGYDPGEGRTLSFADWQAQVHPEDLTQVEPVVRSQIGRGEPFTIEFRYRCADGGWLWVQARGQVMERTLDGSPQRVMGTHVEIDQLKRSELALREREQELAEAKRIGQLGHWSYDMLTGTMAWSNEVYACFGVDPEQGPMDFERFMGMVHPEDREALQAVIDRALQSGELQEIEYRIQRPDGSERTLYERGYTEFDAAGRPLRVRGTTQDVTEQRALERALREREAHYRDLVENQPLLVSRFWPDTTLIDANPTLADYLGMQPDALIGQRWLDFLPAEERGRAQAHLASYTPQEPVGRFENSIPGEDGQRYWVLWTNRAFFDERGALSHFQAVGMDITERRRAEYAEQQLREQLQARQRELEEIFTAARSVSLIKTDLDGVIQEASSGAEAIFDYPRQALIGRHVGFLHTEAERERLPEYVDRLLREQAPIRMETELVRRDGQTFPALFTLHTITDHRGDVVATLGVSLDISEQKRAEQALRQHHYWLEEVQQLARVGYWISYPEPGHGRGAVWWSGLVYEIFGQDPSTFTPSIEAFFECVHPDDRPSVDASIREGERRGGFDYEYRIVRPDGETRWVHEIGRPEYDETGQVERVIGAVQDITEQRRIEEQLYQLASHDPLTGLFNRRRMREQLSAALASFRRHGTPFALIYFDIDHFKPFND
ncbi:MAG: PAS domain-containing protein, partial [Halorhodospira sp.]